MTRTVESVKADLAALDAALAVVRNVRLKEMDSSQARWGDASFDQAYADFGHVYEYLEGYLEGLRDPFRDAKDTLRKMEDKPNDALRINRGDYSLGEFIKWAEIEQLVRYVRYLEGRVAELADKMESYRP